MSFRDFHTNVKIRIYVLFAFGTVQATTFPFMAIYFAKNFGETLTGVLLALCVIGSIVSSIFGGYYADRIGRRKLMIMAEAIFLAAYLVMAMANSPWINSPVLTYVAYFITNACWGVYAPADEAMLLDVTEANNRQAMYSIFYWIHNFTAAIGASIGAVLFEDYRFVLFLSMSIVVLISLIATIFLIQETHFPDRENQDRETHWVKGIIHNYTSVLKDTTFLTYILAGTLVMYLEFQLSNYIGIRLAKEVSAEQFTIFQDHTISFNGINLLGFLQTENTILVVLLAALALRVGKKFHERTTLFIGILLFTLGYSVLTFSSSVVVLFLAMIVATVGEVTSVPIRQAFMGDIAPDHARSSYVAVNGMTYSASRILASFGVVLGTYLSSMQMAILAFVIGMIGYLLYQSIIPAMQIRRNTGTSISTDM